MARLKTAKKKLNLLAGQSFVFWHCLNLITSMSLLRNKEVTLLHTKWNHVMLTETATTCRAVTKSCRLGFQLAIMSMNPGFFYKKQIKHKTKGTSYCQTQKTVNNWKISGMLIVYWPITIKFRTGEETCVCVLCVLCVIYVSQMGEHISQGISFSQVGEHISLQKCVLQVGNTSC